MTATPEKRPVRNPSVVLREEFDDWAILFDPDTGRGFGLSPTGVYVWKLLDGNHSVDALLQKVRDFSDSVPEEAAGHIRTFVDAAVGEGLAGFEGATVGLGESEARRESYPPSSPGHAGEMKPFKYEPPQLVDLSGKQVAHGDCGPGSGASGYCNPQGLRATSDCFQGTLDSKNCIGFGNTAASQCTANGSSATSTCNACGNYLSGGTYCSSGGGVTCYCTVGSAV